MTSGFRNRRSNSSNSDWSHPDNDWVKKRMFPPRIEEEPDEEGERIYVITESRNRTPHIQTPEEKFIIKASVVLMLLYLFWWFVIKPIIVWVQSQLIPFILTTWQNIIHFIQSIRLYLILIIFFILFALFTTVFEKKGIVRPWSLLGAALSSASILLITIAVIGGI